MANATAATLLGTLARLAMVRLGLRPDINALATIIILTVAIGVAIAAYLMLRQQKQAAEAAAR